jgi:RHS repeat-associated protein
VRAVTDSAGSVVQAFASDEFGVPSLTQGTSPEPMRFTGQQRDGESGLYDLRARYYLPGLGRFISRDSLVGSSANPLSLNRFSYVLNNPISLTDPSGLASSAPNDLTLGSTSGVSLALQHAYGSAFTGKGSGDAIQNCLDPTSKLFCGLLVPGPGLLGIAILRDLCGVAPWLCADEGGGSQANPSTIDPNDVRFSQSSISYRFRDRTTIDNLAEGAAYRCGTAR